MPSRKSVLIVDDERTNIVVLTRVLGAHYIIFAAKNGKDAIEAAREHRPDIILLDIFMPEMNGFQAFEHLKNDEATKHIPVIFATGLESAINRERGMSLGAVGYLTKPFKDVDVLEMIRKNI